MATLSEVKRYKIYLTPLVSDINSMDAYGPSPEEIDITDDVDASFRKVLTWCAEDYDNDSDFGTPKISYISLKLDNYNGKYTNNKVAPFSSPGSYFTHDRDLSKVKIIWYDEDDNKLSVFRGLIDESFSVDDLFNKTVSIKVLDYSYILKRMVVNTEDMNKLVYTGKSSGTQLHYHTDVKDDGTTYDDDYDTEGYSSTSTWRILDFLYAILNPVIFTNVYDSVFASIDQIEGREEINHMYIQNVEYFNGMNVFDAISEVLSAACLVMYTDGTMLRIKDRSVMVDSGTPALSDVRKTFYAYTDPQGRENMSVIGFNTGINKSRNSITVKDVAETKMTVATYEETHNAKQKEMNFEWLIGGWWIKRDFSTPTTYTDGYYLMGTENIRNYAQANLLYFGYPKPEIEFETTKEQMQDEYGDPLSLYDLINIYYPLDKKQTILDGIYGSAKYGTSKYGEVSGAFSIDLSVGWKITAIKEDLDKMTVRVKVKMIGTSETDYTLS